MAINVDYFGSGGGAAQVANQGYATGRNMESYQRLKEISDAYRQQQQFNRDMALRERTQEFQEGAFEQEIDLKNRGIDIEAGRLDFDKVRMMSDRELAEAEMALRQRLQKSQQMHEMNLKYPNRDDSFGYGPYGHGLQRLTRSGALKYT